MKHRHPDLVRRVALAVLAVLGGGCAMIVEGAHDYKNQRDLAQGKIDRAEYERRSDVAEHYLSHPTKAESSSGRGAATGAGREVVTLEVEFVVDEAGVPREIRVVNPVDSRKHRAAVAVVSEWRLPVEQAGQTLRRPLELWVETE